MKKKASNHSISEEFCLLVYNAWWSALPQKIELYITTALRISEATDHVCYFSDGSAGQYKNIISSVCVHKTDFVITAE
jgi:hypothetical protein